MNTLRAVTGAGVEWGNQRGPSEEGRPGRASAGKMPSLGNTGPLRKKGLEGVRGAGLGTLAVTGSCYTPAGMYGAWDLCGTGLNHSAGPRIGEPGFSQRGGLGTPEEEQEPLHSQSENGAPEGAGWGVRLGLSRNNVTCAHPPANTRYVGRACLQLNTPSPSHRHSCNHSHSHTPMTTE